MTYRSPSATKNAPSKALSHAAASLRDSATASSCSLPLSLTTFASASNSPSVSAIARKYRRRAFGLSVRKCARTITAIRVNSTEGAGISPVAIDGSARLFGMVTLTVFNAPRRLNSITHGHAFPRKGKSACFQFIHHLLRSRRSRLNTGSGAGPALAPPPLGRRTTFIRHAEKAGLCPAPLCPLPEAARQSAKLSRGYVGLSDSLTFQPHRSGLVLNARDLRPVAKLNENHGSHRSVSKCAPRLEASQ